jgi:prolyl oligopeptidase
MKPQLSLLTTLCMLGVTSIAAAQTTDSQQWLEDVTGEKALNWVKAQNQVTRNKLDNDAGFKQLRSDLQVILNSKDRIPGIRKMGDAVYNFWTDAEHPRGVWRKTSLEEYRKANRNGKLCSTSARWRQQKMKTGYSKTVIAANLRLTVA